MADVFDTLTLSTAHTASSYGVPVYSSGGSLRAGRHDACGRDRRWRRAGSTTAGPACIATLQVLQRFLAPASGLRKGNHDRLTTRLGGEPALHMALVPAACGASGSISAPQAGFSGGPARKRPGPARCTSVATGGNTLQRKKGVARLASIASTCKHLQRGGTT